MVNIRKFAKRSRKGQGNFMTFPELRINKTNCTARNKRNIKADSFLKVKMS
jgi:hypothetical protein